MASITFTAAELKALAAQVAPLIPQGTTPPVVTPPVVTPPVVTPGVFWLFNDGHFAGAGAYDFGPGKVDYSGQTIVVTGDVGAQPRMPADNFNTAGLNYMLISIKPTQAGNNWYTGAEMIGDVPIPGSTDVVSIMKYALSPVMAVGQWNDFKVPLTALSIPPAGLQIYKVALLERASPNKAGNKYEINKWGFSP